jgi:uncharacterized protein (DUF2384 family)
MAAHAKTPLSRKLEAAQTRRLVRWTREELGFTYHEVGTLVGTTTRTAQRWSDPASTIVPGPKHRPRLDAVRELQRLLGLVFATARQRQGWLRGPVPLLDGRRPIDLIRQGNLDEVTQVLAGLHAGSFA